jgi:prepilin-type N-terminal cleavage/methylation domain-containing protein
MNLKNKGLALSLSNGFTLIELVITITIVGVLSGVILFATTQYINKGKDSNIAANLSILIPAGEVYYTNNGNNYGSGSFTGFCKIDNSNNDASNILIQSISQMPQMATGRQVGCWSENDRAVCCSVADDGQSWAACAPMFTNSEKAWCVDSRGVKKEILIEYCLSTITSCDAPSESE